MCSKCSACAGITFPLISSSPVSLGPTIVGGGPFPLVLLVTSQEILVQSEGYFNMKEGTKLTATFTNPPLSL